MTIVSHILLYFLVIGSFILFVANLIDILKHGKKKRRFSDVGWAKWSYAGLGLYWTVIYAILNFAPIADKYAYTSQWIRPSMLYLVFLLLLSKQKPVYLPDLIKEYFQKLKKGRKVYGKN
jgi:uncharacterized membrane protein